MAKKPTHGGSRPNAGRPTTTGMQDTPPVHFRVTAEQRTELDTEGERKGISGNAVAKLRAFPPGRAAHPRRSAGGGALSARGLHVLTGGAFVHEYVGQCASCENRKPGGRYEFRCEAKGRSICCPKLRRGKRAMCPDFKPTDGEP